MSVSAKRNAKIEITSSAAGMDRGLNDARRKMRAFQRDQEKAKTRAKRDALSRVEDRNSRLMGVGRAALGGMAAVAGMDLAGNLTGLMQEVMEFEKRLTRFQIISGKTPAAMNAMRTAIGKVSDETAMSREQILEGAQTYVDLTGDVAGAEKSMRVFARVAQASDSSISDVATSAAALQDAMHVNPDEMEAVFSGLINQGKAGAVNLKDFAGEMSSILPRFARFGVMGREGVVQMGAMFQIGRKGFGSAEQAATGMEGLMGGLSLHADKFEKAGVRIYKVAKDGTKTFRPLNEIVHDIGNSKLAKDPTLLQKAFGRKEGLQFYNMLHDHLDMYDEMIRAGQDVGSVQRDLDTYMQSSAGRQEAAWNRVKLALADAMTPERIQKFTDAVEHAGGALGEIIKTASQLETWADKIGGGFGNSIVANLPGDARWLAKKIGGESEDERIEGIRQDRRDERGAYLEGMHPGEGHDQIEARLQEEDKLRESLQAQGRGENENLTLAQLTALIPQMARSSDAASIEQAIGLAIERGLAKATINIDGSKVNKGAQNSMHARQLSGRGG